MFDRRRRPGAPVTAVVTVTVNPALDQTLWIPGFAAGQVNRVDREVVRPGGKGVNVAARLEALARPGQTLVTAELARAAGDGFEFEPRGEHPLRGKQRPVEILELR